jgi:hypothetical protein
MLDQLFNARSAAPKTSAPEVKLEDGVVRDVERATFIVRPVHLIFTFCGPRDSNEDGWPGTLQTSIASNTRIGFARRIRGSYCYERDRWRRGVSKARHT